jgi:hypothetical protein
MQPGHMGLEKCPSLFRYEMVQSYNICSIVLKPLSLVILLQNGDNGLRPKTTVLGISVSIYDAKPLHMMRVLTLLGTHGFCNL